jgi:L-threonylcarbamoyladenylate synthase
MSAFHLRKARRVLLEGGIVAYPTEAVYGLGCDPLNARAVVRLLELKGRSWKKGLILIASHRHQLDDWIEPLGISTEQQLEQTWPGPVTWLLPARPEVPEWLRGEHTTMAVRVTAHPLAAALCDAFGGPIVSTSANLVGRRPARSILQLQREMGDQIDYLLHGEVGDQPQPTEIRDAASGRVVRAG